MIDLNDYVTKPIISRKAISKEVSDIEIYSMYMGTDKIELNKAISSPLREDNTPSFGFFKSDDGKILFNDFVKGGGDCFMFVKKLYQYNSWYDVYSRIAHDFNLSNKYKCNTISNSNKYIDVRNKKIKVYRSEKCKIQVKRRQWEKYDLEYWKGFNIDIQILKLYNVSPIEYIFINDRPIAADKYAYVYTEYKDNKETIKIYQPYSKYKWFTNNDNSVWQGWNQLPRKGKELIITKSLKDVMSITNTINIPSISVQNEKVNPKDQIIEGLKNRFEKIYVLFDNDYDKESNWGQINANKICEEYGLINIMIDKEYKCTDFSELVYNFNKDMAKTILKNKLI